jgi:tRNA1(Val) A37 N6-methylase TrmN6
MAQKQGHFGLLNGRIKFRRGKYNPTSDAVWLAAFTEAKHGATVLDIGIGTGGVALCLASRRPDLKITGIDRSEEMLSECFLNAALNEVEIELLQADILNWKTNRTFDVVITNPPYFKGTPAKHGAHHGADIFEWIKRSLQRVRPRGKIFMILDAVETGKAIAALVAGNAGDIKIVPLFSKQTSAERVLISARLGVKTGTTLRSGFSMNDERILRDGELI